MITDITGLHHVTSFAGDPQRNNDFHTKTLGLRRIKKTVNFDAPDVYHLYYGDEVGSAGTVMTYFPFPDIGRAHAGTGEVGTTVFSVPEGSLGFWKNHLTKANVDGLTSGEAFGAKQLRFIGGDGDSFAVVEHADDQRAGWANPGSGVSGDTAIRGFHSVSLRLQDDGATGELLKFMGYTHVDTHGAVKRFALDKGNGAHVIDVETLTTAGRARAGSGSVHHVAFAVADRAAQLKVRAAIQDTGYQVTPVIDRDYFWAIYFRTPGGVLFEVSTHEPGFTRDEDKAHLGEALKLPRQHEHLRAHLETHLKPIKD
jgi:glyoxalase family protein